MTSDNTLFSRLNLTDKLNQQLNHNLCGSLSNEQPARRSRTYRSAMVVLRQATLTQRSAS